MTQGQVKLMRIPPARLRANGLKVWKQIKKYLCYKDLVARHSQTFAFDRKPKEKIYLNVMVYFSSRIHPDSENVRKAVSDAIFENDKMVAGCVDFGYDHENPRVEIEICGSKT